MTGKAVVHEARVVNCSNLCPVVGVMAVVAFQRGLNMSARFALRNDIVMTA